ncbi:MAG TPA: hypothetical protein VMA98_13930 [Candidatus Acidoferrales bacterium]|nr:hypothetical protein [Candidatus Acidoferrales bacterium]
MNARRFAPLAILAFAACGGGGSSVAPSISNNGASAMTQKVTISLVVPSNGGSSGARRPAYISASAQGADIAVTQGSAAVSAVLDLSPSSSACTGSGGSRTCTATLTVPVGSDVFTVTIYNEAPVNDAIPSGAAILGIGTSTIDVIAGTTTSVPVYVGGEVASFGATLPSGSLPANGQVQHAVVVIAPTDFGDNPITTGANDPYANPITVAVTESGGSGFASLSLNGGAASSSVQVTQSSDSVTLNYSGGGPPGYSFTIVLSASGVSSQSSTVAPLIAAVGGSAVTAVALNGPSLQLNFGEAGGTRTYAASLSGCTNIATIGSVSGSGAAASLTVTAGSSPSASGCSLAIADSGGTTLVLGVSNTPVTGTVGVNGTTIAEYGGYDEPYGITKGPDGNIWFTDQGTSTLYAINPNSPGSNLYSYTIGEDYLFDVASGSDGALWVSDQEVGGLSVGGVDRVTTSGAIAEYPYTASTITPAGLASNPYDGTLILADETSGGIFTVDMGGQFTRLPFEPSGTPSQVTYAPTDEVWFAENGYVGGCSIASCSSPTETVVPNGDNAQYIAYGSDGNIYFTAYGSGAPFIGWFNPSSPGTINQIALASNATPLGIVAGADNAMWFVDPGTNTIGEVSLATHSVTTFPIPTADAYPQEITVGPDGSLWFTENGAGKIGHVIP